MADNGVVTIEGHIGRFSARQAVKEGDMKALINKVYVPDPDLDLMAKLCPNQRDAVKAMRANKLAQGKIDLPCRNEEMTVAYRVGKRKKCGSNNVMLKKLVYDCRNGKQVAEIHYGEPLLMNVATFYLERLGADIILDIEPMQKTLGFDGDGEE